MCAPWTVQRMAGTVGKYHSAGGSAALHGGYSPKSGYIAALRYVKRWANSRHMRRSNLRCSSDPFPGNRAHDRLPRSSVRVTCDRESSSRGSGARHRGRSWRGRSRASACGANGPHIPPDSSKPENFVYARRDTWTPHFHVHVLLVIRLLRVATMGEARGRTW